MLPSPLTPFHRTVQSDRRFGMSSPTPSVSTGVPVAAVAGIQATSSSFATTTAPSTVNAGGSPPGLSGFPTDLQAQKNALEHLLERKLVEGDLWYVVVAEWLEQLKKFLGLHSSRKYYGQRATSPPGPIVTRRDYAHTVDVVHEDAWRMMLQWYGLAEGHKAMKLVVYKYTRGPEIEHNINSFKVMLSNSPPEDFHIVRFSKMEKIGHVEWKARQLYTISQNQESRLWAKAEADAEWRPLFWREKSIGVVLDMDSDFTRPVVALETKNALDQWIGSPDNCDGPEEEEDIIVRGHLLETSMFDEVTTTWELDVHEQIDHLGKTLVDKLHGDFNVFVQRAKDYIATREHQLRERERQVCARESVTERLATRLEIKEHRLGEEVAKCEQKIKEYESRRLELERQATDREEALQKRQTDMEAETCRLQEDLREEKERFREELRIMAELRGFQDSKLKLDIGGNQFTTSLLTLTKDPNSMLSAMFSGRHELKVEDDGSYFIDRDGTHFRYVLNYLRDGCVKEGTLPASETMWRELLTEAEYYQLHDLADALTQLIERKDADA